VLKRRFAWVLPMTRRVLALAALLVPLICGANAYGATLHVTSTANSGPGSLRAVVGSASAGDVIDVPASSKHYTLLSEIQITVPLTIEGAGARSTIIDAGGHSRAFEVTSGVPSTSTVTFRGLAITGGVATTAPGGGAILADSGDLNIVDSAITHDTATLNSGVTANTGGGGIYNASGDTTLTDSVLSYDTATVTSTPDSSNCCHGGGGLFENGGDITITGSQLNHDTTTVQGSNASSDDPCCGGGGAVYQNTSDGSVTVTGSTLDRDVATIRGGQCCHGGGAIYVDVGPFNIPFVVTASHLNHDTTTVTTKAGQGTSPCCSGGGAVATFGGISATNDTFDYDTATLKGQECCNGGGAINVDSGNPTMSFHGTDISHDSTSITDSGSNNCCNGGGALQLDLEDGPLSIVGSTLAYNNAKVSGASISGGGAVYEDESTPSNTYSNTTLADNTTSAYGATQGGGAIYQYNDTGATDTLLNTTVADNSAPHGVGGGILTIAGTVAPTNSIIALNHASTGDNCATAPYFGQTAVFTSGGHNLENENTCSFTAAGDQASVNPKLGAPQRNGSPLLTLALLDHSPGINAGLNSACPPTDERAVRRPQPPGGVCDIGAYEATAPYTSAKAVSKRTAVSAQLNGLVNPANLTTSYFFEWGKTTAYGHKTARQTLAGGVFAQQPVSAQIKGLKSGQTYHFRVVATNEIGTTMSADRTFTTR
jgi:hypothetical protein